MASATTASRRGRTIAIVAVLAFLAAIGGWLLVNSAQPVEESAADQTVEWTMSAGEFGELTITPLKRWELTPPDESSTSWIDRSTCEDEEKCPVFYVDALEGENDEDCQFDPNSALCTMDADDASGAPDNLPLPVVVEASRLCYADPADLDVSEVEVGGSAATLSALTNCEAQNGAAMYWWYVEGDEEGQGLLINAYDPAGLLDGADDATEVFTAGTLG